MDFGRQNANEGFQPPSDADSGDVPSSRTVSTTAPLAGGGSLAANRTLSVLNSTATNVGVGDAGKLLKLDAAGKAAGRVLEADGAKLDGIEALADVTDAANVAAAGAVMTTRTVSTTAPLSGGGDLSADRTLALENQAANTVLAGPVSGAADGPTARALVPKDIPQTLLTKVSAGRNGAGALALLGTQVGDVVQCVATLTAPGGDASASFEATITVPNEIQQSSGSDLSTVQHLFIIRRQATA